MITDMANARIVIAGTSSGVGKTSITLGLARALSDSGRTVQAFKVGPDFLDPVLLGCASRRTCLNLDSWMTSPEYIADLYRSASEDADISIIEGVMGMFDGADPTTIEGSSAEIALILSAPVILVVNAHGAAGSIAPMVKGFAEFHPEIRIAGVIANRCGSERHRDMLGSALKAAGLPPLLGAIPKDAIPAIPERHLGVLTCGQSGFPEELFERLADSVAKHVDLRAISEAAATASSSAPVAPARAAKGITTHVRIGVANDSAFFFYYPDNLSLLESHGAELVRFSPLNDTALPTGLDALYIGGGYPEEYAEQLSANAAMLSAIRAFAASGRTVYAECGGLMYLSRDLTDRNGTSFQMAGILPHSTRMLTRLRTLGYRETVLNSDCMFGKAGAVLRGHEFHYSEIAEETAATEGWIHPYRAASKSGKVFDEGFMKRNVLASYIHQHFGSNQQALRHFIEYIHRSSNDS